MVAVATTGYFEAGGVMRPEVGELGAAE